MTVAQKPWTEMTEYERFVDDLRGTLLLHSDDPKGVDVVIARLDRAVEIERQTAVESATEHAPDFGSDS